MQEMLPEFPHWLFSCISILFVNSKNMIIKLDPKLSKEEVVYTEMNSVDDRASLSLVYWLLAIATIHFQVFPILIWILSRLNKIGISRKRAHSQGTPNRFRHCTKREQNSAQAAKLEHIYYTQIPSPLSGLPTHSRDHPRAIERPLAVHTPPESGTGISITPYQTHTMSSQSQSKWICVARSTS